MLFLLSLKKHYCYTCCKKYLDAGLSIRRGLLSRKIQAVTINWYISMIIVPRYQVYQLTKSTDSTNICHGWTIVFSHLNIHPLFWAGRSISQTKLVEKATKFALPSLRNHFNSLSQTHSIITSKNLLVFTI